MAKTEKAEPKVVHADGYENINFDEWVDTFDGGYPPYWQPEKGAKFFAKPVSIDLRDPKFIRVVFEALQPLECQRGPVDEAEQVLVEPGQFFTTSIYAAFQDIDMYIGMPVMVHAKEKKRQTSDPSKSYWVFEGKVSPENAKRIQATKMQRFRELQASGKAEVQAQLEQ